MSSAEPTHQLADALRQGGPTLVLTGAGVSLASGIPTFRGTDAGAIWASTVMARATRQHFVRDPADTWTWYRERHAQVLAARPNAAHHALASLERWLAARGHALKLVTQNIDVLHEAAGSTSPVKVHGSIDRARCSNERCAEAETTVATATLDFAAFDAHPDAATIPTCAACGARMRPHVLWFDEYYDGHDDYQWGTVVSSAQRQARLVLFAGTSFAVGVTETILRSALARSVPVFNLDPIPRIDEPGVRSIAATAEVALVELCNKLGVDVTDR